MSLIVRTYLCDDCGTQFDSVEDRKASPPECPGCAAISRKIPSGFQMTTTKSQAIDIAQNVIEKDWGMTDMKDRLREGDTAAPSLPARLQPAVNNFFAPPGEIIASARAGAQAAKAEGSNPLTLMQKVNKQRGHNKVLFNPVARG